jgi:hypothetical protein
MSLTTAPAAPKQFRLGIVASKGVDDPDFLADLVGPNVAVVSHIYTNGANRLVSCFAASEGIPCTVFPLTGRSLPWSTGMILDNVDFVYIISSPDSKSTTQVEADCIKRKVKYKMIPYTPFEHWKGKVSKVAEILYTTPKEVIEASEVLKAIWREV